MKRFGYLMFSNTLPPEVVPGPLVVLAPVPRGVQCVAGQRLLGLKGSVYTDST